MTIEKIGAIAGVIAIPLTVIFWSDQHIQNQEALVQEQKALVIGTDPVLLVDMELRDVALETKLKNISIGSVKNIITKSEVLIFPLEYDKKFAVCEPVWPTEITFSRLSPGEATTSNITLSELNTVKKIRETYYKGGATIVLRTTTTFQREFDDKSYEQKETYVVFDDFSLLSFKKVSGLLVPGEDREISEKRLKRVNEFDDTYIDQNCPVFDGVTGEYR